jgi:peptidase M28-like protein/PDZ domain-containing protein/PA domain-containing protein
MRPFNRLLPYAACILSVALQAAPPATTGTTGIDPQRYLSHIKYLAAPEMRGRATGSPELEKAADYIAAQFRAIGLKPVDGTSYFQAFPVTTNARLGQANRFEVVENGKTTGLKTGEDFIPFNFSSRGKLTGGVVFAGYGITAPEYNYDDYAGLNVKDKLVLILRHEPQEFEERSVFAGKAFTEHAQFFSKAVNAKMHGARGVILINDQFNHRGDTDQLEKFGRTVGPTDAGIPFVQIKEEIAARWIADAGKNLDEIGAAIDKDLKPRSFALPDSVEVRENVDVERVIKTVHNVGGYLPGETDEYLVIGAHFDHLGLGEQFSMAPSLAGTTVHPGADDNASGTAGVIELARWFAAQPKQKRGILFLTFAGEELGLLGSSFYVNHPDLPINKAVAMINLDMIGRVREGKVYVGGVGTGSNLRATLDPILARYPMHIDYSDSTGYGSSDHTSFTTKQVPVLFFFSGLHGDYHKPGDTWDKIDAPDAAKLLDMIAAVGTTLREEAERPLFVRVKEPESPHGGAAVGSSQSGYGPEFGSIPDFAEIPHGVRFADIRDGTPAAQAGLKAGDILVEFDGKPIGNLYDFTYALRSKKPGDRVTVKVLRGTETVTASVLLRERK